ncbi:endonuclease/exonuclease/phosphatase family protein [Pseudobdellovibrio exovorus]|uniref:Endonuclease/exonuclease/phosphatase domain-containing protein n=1 Tax=Pseudobdellovibrio exovorus JSS TaxID=1184267 RepID=M4V9N7_9BACT|nr:endonuclease/exonuclease/phosphatase family protein [Pseudobdellovibrio exovorus]AGH94741.1 hypothetical protein A11Q_521 [Pseudobdellovibrio exovorus JSS]
MKNTVLKSSLVVLLSFTALVAQANTSVLCNSSHNQHSFANQIQSREHSQELSVITWNAHKLADNQFLPDLATLSTDSDIILIQEAMHSNDLQNYFASQFDLSFSFHKSFCNKENQATGVMTASRYLLQSNLTLVSTDTEPFTFTPKVSGYSAVQIPEIGVVHIINTHGLNFNTGSKFKRQMTEISKFIAQLEGPVIWAGDFNTWNSDRQAHLDKNAAALGLHHLKPTNEKRNLKLDHIYVRGLELQSVELLRHIKSSDHLPLKAVFKKAPSNLFESEQLAEQFPEETIEDAIDTTDMNRLSDLHPDSDN